MVIKMIQPWSSSWFIMQILQRKQSVKLERMSTQKRLKATSSAQFTSHCTIMIFQARLNFNLRCHSFLYQHTCQMKVKASWHQFLACYLHCQSDVKCSALHTDIINHVDRPCGYRLSPSIQGFLRKNERMYSGLGYSSTQWYYRQVVILSSQKIQCRGPKISEYYM